MSENVAALKQKIEQLEELHRLAQSLSSILNVYETLESISACCAKLCQAEHASLVLFGSAADESVETVVRTAATTDNQGIDHILNSLTAGWVAHHRKPLLTADVLEEFKIKSPSDHMRKLGPALAVPLVIAERIIGVINLANLRAGRRFTEEDLRICMTLAPLAARFIDRADMYSALARENQELKKALHHQYASSLLLGESRAMREVREKISVVASSSATVLLTGETGTGKELVARSIHYESPRREKPFVAVNCAAIPDTLVESELFGHERGAFTGATEMRKGKFELAHKGTLFLDEISAMNMDLQAKLLRVLEDRTFCRIGSSVDQHADVRVIAATNRDLLKAVHDGSFREDLYHRLHVVPLYLAPLRDRPEDIPLLAQSFLQQLSHNSKHFATDALSLLSALPWKGNVRELRNVVERISLFITSPEIAATHLHNLGIGEQAGPASGLQRVLEELLLTNQPGRDLLEEIEKQVVETALEQTHGNVSQAARMLGIDRNALQRRIEKYGVRYSSE